MTRNTKFLIGCGALLAMVLCIAGVVALSGVGTMIFGTDTVTTTLKMEIRVVPNVIREGERYEVRLSAENLGDETIPLDEVLIPAVFLSASRLIGTTPTDRGHNDYGDSVGFQFGLSLAAGERETITFEFEALQAGDYVSGIEIVSSGNRVSEQARVVITPRVAAATPGEQVLSTPVSPPADTPGRIPYQAVVQIIALYKEDEQLRIGWTGSGSIIDPDGLILTNSHVVLPDKYYPVDALQVALTLHEDRPPTPMYFAEVLQADPSLDIAILRLTTDLEGNQLDRNTLDLPVVPLGNSDELRLGDSLRILGYPGIGGETITLTPGEVGGFTSEEQRGDRAFVKTSATIAGGNSGGLAANERGELIGVPTQLGYGGEDQYVDCRVLADTNRDGVIDEMDNCVPTGGFINALRPVNLALPLIEAARRGEVNIGAPTVEEGSIPGGGSVVFQDDFSDPDSGWDVGGDDTSDRRYRNGKYEIEVIPDNYFVWSNPGRLFEDVIVTVSSQPEQATGEGDFGVLCRYQDEENFYALEISEDGYFSIWKSENGEFITLVDWEYTRHIPVDGSPVALTVACIGDRLTLLADGVLLAEASDSSFSSGDVGLIAGTWGQGGLVIAFDDFKVQEP